MNKLSFYGFIISTILCLSSCGSANNFHKSSRLKKVRVNNNNTQKEINEETVEIYEIEVVEEESTFEASLETADLIDQVDDEITNEEVIETEQEDRSFSAILKQTKAVTTQGFNDNHYATLSTFLGGVICGAMGFVYWNAIPYILAFCLFAATLVLTTFMKYKVAPKQSDSTDRKYKNRMWLTNFAFYASMLVVLLSFIAFLVILI